jgi:hypothetical protein
MTDSLVGEKVNLLLTGPRAWANQVVLAQLEDGLVVDNYVAKHRGLEPSYVAWTEIEKVTVWPKNS